MPAISFGESTQSFTNHSFSFSSPSLHYSDGWTRSSSSFHLNSTIFASSSHVEDSVSFNLPENATALYYFGLKQARGGRYNVCIDCGDDNSTSIELIDAHDSKASTFVELLYQITDLDPGVPHSFRLVNLPDSRFANTSTITVQSFVVTVVNETKQGPLVLSRVADISQSLLDTQALTSTSTMPSSSDPALPSSVSATLSPASASASVNANLTEGEAIEKAWKPRLMYAGIIAASVMAFLIILFALMHFMRRRKRKRTAPYQADPAHWAARFFGEKGTRKSILAELSPAPGLNMRRMKSFATSENEYRRNLTQDIEKAGGHAERHRSPIEVLLPQNPAATRQAPYEKSSTTSSLKGQPRFLADPSPPSKLPFYSPAQPNPPKTRQSAGGLSTILHQQLGTSDFAHRFSKSEPKKEGRVLNPTLSPSRKPVMVSSPLSRNPPWTYATLSHIHATQDADVAGRQYRPQAEQAVDSDAWDGLLTLPDQQLIPPPAPSSGWHAAEAYARIRERAQIGTASRMQDSRDVKGGKGIVNGSSSEASQSVRDDRPQTLLDSYYTSVH